MLDVTWPWIFSRHVGRYQLILAWQYVGDAYGFPNSEGWQFIATFVRNPIPADCPEATL